MISRDQSGGFYFFVGGGILLALVRWSRQDKYDANHILIISSTIYVHCCEIPVVMKWQVGRR